MVFVNWGLGLGFEDQALESRVVRGAVIWPMRKIRIYLTTPELTSMGLPRATKENRSVADLELPNP